MKNGCRRSISLAALVVACLFVGSAVAEEGEGWISLFDGKTLTGWKANLHPDSFTVVDGAIRARCTSSGERSHLFYVGEDAEAPRKFVDFEMFAEARAEPGSNGGIFFQTDQAVRDARKHLASGYEVQLNSSPTERRKTGSLYGVVDLDASPVDETNWFEVRLRVEGKRIRVWIGGEPVVDYVEPDRPERTESRAGRRLRVDGGQISLQAHDPDSVIYYRDLRVRPLAELP